MRRFFETPAPLSTYAHREYRIDSPEAGQCFRLLKVEEAKGRVEKARPNLGQQRERGSP